MPGTRMLESVVRENARRFFLWDVPFVVTTVYRLDDGDAMGGAIESAVVQALTEGAADAGLRVRVVHPEDDKRLTLRVERSPEVSATVSTFRAVVVGAALAIALLFAIFAPILGAKRATRQAERELAELARAEQRVNASRSDQERAATLIASLAKFEHSRQSATLLLAELTNAIPRESAVTTVRSDSTGVDLVVVSPRAAGVLGALDRVPGIVAPQIIGPISREVTGTREMERATIHFKYDPVDDRTPRVAYAVRRAEAE